MDPKTLSQCGADAAAKYVITALLLKIALMASAGTGRPLFKLPRPALAAKLENVKRFSDIVVTGVSMEEAASAYNIIWKLPCLSGHEEGLVLAAVKRWALEALDSPMMLEPLMPGSAREFPAKQCRSILANALLGNIADVMHDSKHNQGGLDFRRHVRSAASSSVPGVAAHKQASLLLYFCKAIALEGTDDDQRMVRFERIACPTAQEMLSRLTSATGVPLLGSDSDIVLHDGSMEAASVDDPACTGMPLATRATHGEHCFWPRRFLISATSASLLLSLLTGFVNFANADFGYGCFIPSATQEEILQVVC